MKTKPNRILAVFISMLMVFMCMTSASVQAAMQRMTLKFNKIEVSAGADIQLDVIATNAIPVREINDLTINIPDGFTVTGMSETSPAFNGTVNYNVNGNYLNFSIASNGTVGNSDIAASIYMHVDENCEAKNYMFQWTTNAVSCKLPDGSGYTPQFTFGIVTVGEGGDVQTTTTTPTPTQTTTTTETTTTTPITTTMGYYSYSISFIDEETGQYVSGVEYTVDNSNKISGNKPFYDYSVIYNNPKVSLVKLPDGYISDTTYYYVSPNYPDLTIYLHNIKTTTTTETTTTTTTTTTTMTTTTTTVMISLPYVEIRVNNMPDKTFYTIGEELDLTGLTIDLGNIYYNVSPMKYPDEFTIDTSDFNPYKAGTYSIQIKVTSLAESKYNVYIGKRTCTFYVAVHEPTTNTTPTTMTTTTTTTTMTTTTTTVRTSLPYLEIRVDNMPNKTFYTIGEELDLTGLTIDVFAGTITIYNNVSPMDYPDKFIIYTSDFNPYKAGTQQIRICGNYSAFDNPIGESSYAYFYVTVFERTTTTTPTTTTTTETTTTTAVYLETLDLEIVSLPNKTVYQIGEELDLSGIEYKITEKMSDGTNGSTKKPVQTDTSEFDSTKAGTYKIYASIELDGLRAEDSFEVTVSENTESFSLGDANNDGFINAVDASIVSIEYALLSTGDHVGKFTDEQNDISDLNKDGKINAVDASLISMYYAYLSTEIEKPKDEIDIWLVSVEISSTLSNEPEILDTTTTTTTITTTTTTTKLPAPKLMPFKKQIRSINGTMVYSTWNEIEEADGYEVESTETQSFPDAEPYINNYNTHDTYFETGGSVALNIKLRVRAYKVINGYNKIYSDWSTINECNLLDFPMYTGDTLWEKIYTKKIEEISQSEYFNGDTYMWDLFDIDLDGTPELFISTGEYRTAGLYIYTIYNSECVSIDKGYGNYGIAKVIPSKKMIEFFGGIHGYIYYIYCQLSQYDRELNQVVSLSNTSMAENNDIYKGYMINDEIVSQDDYNNTIDYFDQFLSYEVGRADYFGSWEFKHPVTNGNDYYDYSNSDGTQATDYNNNNAFDPSLVGVFDRDAGDGYGYFDVYGNYYPYTY